MSDVHNQHSDADFEQQDLSLRPMFIALAGLAVVCVAVAVFVVGVDHALEHMASEHETPQHPLVTRTVPDPRTATKEQFQGEIKDEFPQPRLEENERGELRDFRMGEEEQLNSYGDVDGKPGVVHISITRAMQLVVQRGLPVAPAASGEVAKKSGK